MHRIECGEKEAENIVFEALFQRLGKSLSRLEYFILKEEYYEICLKELILYNIQEKEYEFANLFLEEYQLKIENKNILYHQSAVLRNDDSDAYTYHYGFLHDNLSNKSFMSEGYTQEE